MLQGKRSDRFFQQVLKGNGRDTMKSRTFTLLISFFAALIMASVAEAGTGL
jgi:hypothetical protein